MRYNFNEIGFSIEKTGKCPNCGKKAKRTKRFYQTINPFNKNAEGNIKTKAEIFNQLKIESDKWEKEHVYHAKCE